VRQWEGESNRFAHARDSLLPQVFFASTGFPSTQQSHRASHLAGDLVGAPPAIEAVASVDHLLRPALASTRTRVERVGERVTAAVDRCAAVPGLPPARSV
jgi:hypothetical protein